MDINELSASPVPAPTAIVREAEARDVSAMPIFAFPIRAPRYNENANGGEALR